MERISQFRARLLLLLFAVLLGFYAVRMYDLQIIETGGGTVDNSTVYVTKTRVKAARGDILDCNGNVLVGNRASYDMVFNHYVLQGSATPNESLYQLVKLCQELGIEYTEHFPVSTTWPFTYTLEEQSSTWQSHFQTFLTERGNIDSDITAPVLIQRLRSSYEIPEEWTDEEARAVIGLRYELSLRNYTNLATYVFIADASDEDRAAILELNIPGLNVEASTVREYYTEYAAHILGYVGAMSPEQWEYYEELGYSMDAEVGQSGFELAFEEYLHGTDGWRIDKVAPDGTLISSEYSPAPQSGSNVEVTIDINLQAIAEEQLDLRLKELRSGTGDGSDAAGGAVVVMEVGTGKILACASNPTYNLATFRSSQAEYDAVKNQEYSPLYNRALSAIYPPGSTFKMTMVIAANNARAINMESTFTDKGKFTKYEESGYAPTCLKWTTKGQTHGTINAAEALRDSCNYFFYELAERIDLEDMDSTAKGLGLGEPTGVELSESIGRRANAESKKQYGSDPGWYAGDQLAASIGQSEHRYTPLQLCVYTSTLANRGTRYAATFLNRVVSDDYSQVVVENQPEIINTLSINNDAYLSYTEGMRMVAHESKGTAYTTFRNYPITVAAKTGTAQTDKKDASDNGAFVCYAPYDDPEIAIAVYGEQAGHGSSMAVVARSILDVYFEVDGIGDVTTNENKIS